MEPTPDNLRIYTSFEDITRIFPNQGQARTIWDALGSIPSIGQENLPPVHRRPVVTEPAVQEEEEEVEEEDQPSFLFGDHCMVQDILDGSLPEDEYFRKQVARYYIATKFTEFFTDYKKMALTHNYDYASGKLLEPTASFLIQLENEDSQSMFWNQAVYKIATTKNLDHENVAHFPNFSCTYSSKYLHFDKMEMERYGRKALGMHYMEDLIFVYMGLAANLRGIHEYCHILATQMEWCSQRLRQESLWMFKWEPHQTGRSRMLEYQKRINDITKRMVEVEDEITFFEKMRFIHEELFSGASLLKDMEGVKKIFLHIYKSLKGLFHKIYTSNSVGLPLFNDFEARYNGFAFTEEFKKELEELEDLIRRHAAWESEEVEDNYVCEPCFFKYGIDHQNPSNHRRNLKTCEMPLILFIKQFQAAMANFEFPEGKCICNIELNPDGHVKYRENMIGGIPVFGIFDSGHFQMAQIHKSTGIHLRQHIIYWRETALMIFYKFLKIMLKSGAMPKYTFQSFTGFSKMDFKKNVHQMADFGYMVAPMFVATNSALLKTAFYSMSDFVERVSATAAEKILRTKWKNPSTWAPKLKKVINAEMSMTSDRIPTVRVKDLALDLKYHEKRREILQECEAEIPPQKRQKLEKKKKKKEEKEELTCEEELDIIFNPPEDIETET